MHQRLANARQTLEQAGIEIYKLAKELMHIENLQEAQWWVESLMQWCEFWADFLSEKTRIEGRLVYTHERLVKARRGLINLVNKKVLFTYLDPQLTAEGPLPRTNNMIEGGVNSQLRDMVKNHRGMSLVRRLKAVYWWCYMHTECPKQASEILKSMPTDAYIDRRPKRIRLALFLYEGDKHEEDEETTGHHQPIFVAVLTAMLAT